MSTPNGQKVQIMLEELRDVYGTEWTQTLMYAPFELYGLYLDSKVPPGTI